MNDYPKDFESPKSIKTDRTGNSNLLNSVISDLGKREDKGKREYGVTLDKANLTELELLNHLYEEQLDAAMYTKALILKKQTTNEPSY